MKDAVELRGYSTDKGTYILAPTGNHRNQQRVQLQPAAPSAPGAKCPRCKGALRAWVQTFPTDEYEAWTKAAVADLRGRYYPCRFAEPVVVYLWVFGGKGFMESRDWDNVQKCVGDAMVVAGVLPCAPGAKGKEGEEPIGGDDVRSIKGWRTHYLDRQEHVKLTKGAAGNKDNVRARLFVQIVPASQVDPFHI